MVATVSSLDMLPSAIADSFPIEATPFIVLFSKLKAKLAWCRLSTESDMANVLLSEI